VKVLAKQDALVHPYANRYETSKWQPNATATNLGEGSAAHASLVSTSSVPDIEKKVGPTPLNGLDWGCKEILDSKL